MKSIVFTAHNQVELKDLPDPQAATGEVVVDVKTSGICHTDFEVLRGNYGSSAFPLVPGHEYAGVIAEVGTGVEGFSVGDRVVVDPNLACGECRACDRGWAHLCDKLQAYGVTQNGGFAERSVVSASAVHSIGDMSFTTAALAEPLGCALNGLQAAQAERATNALIFGAGPIGLLLALGLRQYPLKEIALVDIDESKLAFVQDLGFRAIASGSAELESMKAETDLVIDATGVTAVASGLVNYIANGGVGLFFGICPSDVTIPVAPYELFRRQITLAGSHSLNHNIPEALRIMQQVGPQQFDRVVSPPLPLNDIAHIFTDGLPKGSLKVHCEMNG